MANDGFIPVTFEESITQIVENTEFAGAIAYGGTKLDFTVKFPETVQAIETRRLQSTAEAREFCQIVLTKNGETLELEDDEYDNFVILIAALSYDFAMNGQTQGLNQGMSGMADVLKAFGASVEASMLRTQTLSVGPESIKVLADPKFGATLGTAL